MDIWIDSSFFFPPYKRMAMNGSSACLLLYGVHAYAHKHVIFSLLLRNEICLDHRVCASPTLLVNARVIVLIIFLLEVYSCYSCSTTVPDFKMFSSNTCEMLSQYVLYLQFP